MPDNPRFSNYTHNYFLVRHLLAIALAVVVAVIAFQVPVETWERIAPLLFIVSLALLVAVLVPFIGKGVNGARRWISLGVISFQPSELAKFSAVVYASGYMVRKMAARENFFQAVLPMGVAVGFVGVLLLAEPDMGAFMVIAMIAMGILFLGGVNGRMILAITAVLVGAFVLMITLSEWRRERIFAYLSPWDVKYAAGKAYQLTHSLIAFGRGGWFGQGLGSSVEKLHYLPEAHTDFLLAVIGEELGLAGVVCVIAAFFSSPLSFVLVQPWHFPIEKHHARKRKGPRDALVDAASFAHLPRLLCLQPNSLTSTSKGSLCVGRNGCKSSS
jgi:cell division protein FtsW